MGSSRGVYPDRFGAGVIVDGVHSCFSAIAALAETPERGDRRDHSVGVYPDDARMDGRRDPMSSGHIFGEHTGT